MKNSVQIRYQIANLAGRMNDLFETDPTELSTYGNWKSGLNKKRAIFGYFKKEMKDLKAEREMSLAMEEYDTPESMNLYFIDREFDEYSPELCGDSAERIPTRIMRETPEDIPWYEVNHYQEKRVTKQLEQGIWEARTKLKLDRVDLFCKILRALREARTLEDGKKMHALTERVNRVLDRQHTQRRQDGVLIPQLALTVKQKRKIRRYVRISWDMWRSN